MRKKTIKEVGYNIGDKYEDRIAKILINKKILPENYQRAGASNKSDIIVNYKGKNINIEIKAEKKSNPDFGQVSLKWNTKKKWYWAPGKGKEEVIKIYEKQKIIQNHINFIPKRFTKDKKKITLKDQKFDAQMEKPGIEIPKETLFKYYEGKNNYYIQVENLGFFHLAEDIFNIGTVEFPARIDLRLRHKLHDSYEYKPFPKNLNKIKHYDTKNKKWVIRNKYDREPPHKRYCTGKPTPGDYSFFGVMKRNNKIEAKPSKFDIEELDGRGFPFK